MKTVLLFIISFVLCYLFGSFNASIFISKSMYKDDIRKKGSGNAGATNMLRVNGKKAAILTFACDILKTIIAEAIVVLLFKNSEYQKLALGFGGLMIVLGHCYPVFFNFKGGKGIVVGGVLTLFVDLRVGAVVWGVFVIILIISKIVSLSSIMACVSYPISLFAFPSDYQYKGLLILSSVLVAGFIIVKHSANIKRIINGKESKISFKK